VSQMYIDELESSSERKPEKGHTEVSLLQLPRVQLAGCQMRLEQLEREVHIWKSKDELKQKVIERIEPMNTPSKPNKPSKTPSLYALVPVCRMYNPLQGLSS
jgi:hypothetical protein